MTDALEEFDQIVSSFSMPGLQQKVMGMIANHQINQERFVDLYQMHAHNLASAISKSNNSAQIATEVDIIRHIEDAIEEEQQKSRTGKDTVSPFRKSTGGVNSK